MLANFSIFTPGPMGLATCGTAGFGAEVALGAFAGAAAGAAALAVSEPPPPNTSEACTIHQVK